MANIDTEAYSKLYDVVAENKKKSGSELDFTRQQFLSDVAKPPAELKGPKGNIIYLILKICKNRQVQLILQKMPKWILNIGRIFVG